MPNLTFKHLMTTASQRSARLVGVVISPSHMHCRQSQASSHPLHPIVTPQSHALSSLTDVVTLATSRRHTAVTRTVVTHRRRHTRYAPSSHLSHMHCRQSQASSHQLRPIASVTTPARRVDSSTWLQVEVNL